MIRITLTLLFALLSSHHSAAVSPAPPYITPTDFVIDCQVERIRIVNGEQRTLLALLTFKRTDLTSFGGVAFSFPSESIWLMPPALSAANFEIPNLTRHRMDITINKAAEGETFRISLDFRIGERVISSWGSWDSSKFDLNSTIGTSVGETSAEEGGSSMTDQLAVLCQRTQ